MTVSSTSTKTGLLAGNDATTSFSFSFRAFATSDVKVLHVPALGDASVLTEGVDYDVTLNADQEASPGGSVTYPRAGDPLPTGDSLLLYAEPTSTQLSAIGNQGSQFPQVTERALDRLTVVVNAIKEALSRAPKFPMQMGQAGVDLPSPEGDKYLGWNSDADRIENKDPGSVVLAVPADSSVSTAKMGGDVTNFAKTFLQATDAAAARVLLAISTFGSSLAAAADAAAARTLLGVGTIGTKNTLDVADIPAGAKGAVAKHKRVSTATWTTDTNRNASLLDDSIPQITEGTQILSTTFDLGDAANVVEIAVGADVAFLKANDEAVFAVFVDSVADAIGVVLWTSDGAENYANANGKFYYSPGDTSSHTYTVRLISNDNNSAFINGNATARLFGGIAETWMTLREVTAI